MDQAAAEHHSGGECHHRQDYVEDQEFLDPQREAGLQYELVDVDEAQAVVAALGEPALAPQLDEDVLAVGLTLQEEKRKGWDVRIQFPSGPSCPKHALFLQFKAGEHKNYSKHKGSCFFGS